MLTREEFDLPAILRAVVSPALAQVLRPGELESMKLSWGGRVVLADGSLSQPTELTVDISCSGEGFKHHMWGIGMDAIDLEFARVRLVDELQNFVAESKFGWGQQR